MPQIMVLPVELRNKIAAGEVIERPASAVKELIENSIDAGSTEIRIEILRGGKGLIKVTDNGGGMDRDDALLSLQRHATSKLRSEKDLFHITTLGFRGEALPSIASVSRMKLVTGLKDAPSGISIDIHGGEIEKTKDAPAVGTSIEIRDIFFNTPARKKFLKADSTELFHIIDAVSREALSHWDIGFRLFTETQETMNLPRASGPRERILQIYGLEFIEGLMEVSNPPSPPFSKGGIGGIKMTAFVTKGDHFRNNKAHQFIFINRRPVKDQTISHAVYDAYKGIIPHDQHPVFFLFLEIDPGKVDFNVHPAKREVRFEKKQEIHGFVSAHLREAVRKERAQYIAPFAEAPAWAVSEMSVPFVEGEGGVSPSSGYGTFPPSVKDIAETMEFPYQPSLPFLYLGDTFIAMAGKGGLTLIDHHAAHERILYESFLKRINLDSHTLLFPKQVKLSPKEYAVILQEKALLSEMGMEIDDFGHHTLIVRSLPDALKEADMRGILSDVAAALLEETRPFQSIKEVLAARIACHSSVRGKEILHQEEFQRLLHRLENTENPDQCPHGRPTRIFLSLDDLKKMFKRK
ncbi:MAG: DNA mismatch repair endonuclease MutL [Nitrospirae bacterium]|nr:DNA mismatch repair endonuclease MutL [Nitrospirota bacterium]MCL5420880.1 DNA mismatch repair endonuclease MutL [Nitrospirota bacterium]